MPPRSWRGCASTSRPATGTSSCERRMTRRAAMGLLFYPRGGSSQVVRYLAAALADADWHASVYCGSLGPVGAETNAATFFSGLGVHAVDYSAAVAASK